MYNFSHQFREDLDYFHKIYRGSDTSAKHQCLAVMTFKEYGGKNADELIEMLCCQHLVITGCPHEQHTFDKEGLVRLGSLTRHIIVHGPCSFPFLDTLS